MRTLILAALLIALAHAQEPLPQFEVATVRLPDATERHIALFNYPGGRILITNYTFEQVIEEAFQVQRYQVSGGPDWVYSERFVIEAKPAESSKLSTFTPSNHEAPLVDAQRQMLLALLIDRFQLKLHRELKEGPVYLLTKGQKEPALKPTLHPDGHRFLADCGGDGSVEGGNATMDFLAKKWSRSLRRPVLDRTGLTGAFDFTLRGVFEPDTCDSTDIAQITVHELHLKLESSTGPIETILIDHAERPSAN